MEVRPHEQRAAAAQEWVGEGLVRVRPGDRNAELPYGVGRPQRRTPEHPDAEPGHPSHWRTHSDLTADPAESPVGIVAPRRDRRGRVLVNQAEADRAPGAHHRLTVA